ncbi:hypothetical protein H6P81_016894 [Aristolochia fimbriata]|uniref:C2H2-type domain-containing protein n=1 Tax=Aristolochia fimbriata TaxID=158543 RepID=A0AAV7DYD2_ARIFI|nr:hypothetical protein H6P81_016894 [Aristolochia fimbriata]
MATGKVWGPSMANGCSLREAMALATLREVHSKGHPYVEIRKDGKRPIFFCTLCLSRCYSDSALNDHLRGYIHSQRYAAAKVTLFGPIPWPFSDGVLFFHNSSEKELKLLTLESSNNMPCNSNSAMTVYSRQNSNGNSSSNNGSTGVVVNGHNNQIVIPGILLNDKISSLGVEHMGMGQIGVRLNEISNCINRIWCAWLGQAESDDNDKVSLPSSDFGIVVFSYHYDLGRKPVASDLSLLGSSSPSIETISICGKRRIKSFSDPGDYGGDLDDNCDSAVEDCLDSNNSSEKAIVLHKNDSKDGSNSEHDDCQVQQDCLDTNDSIEKAIVPLKENSKNALTTEQYDHQLQPSRIISKKAIRKALRKQQRIAAERMCDMCQQKMLPGKDVATLFNCKTGNVACKSRNTNGAFHVFHISCLIHWILLCEYEIWNEQATNAKLIHENSGRKTKKKRGPKPSKVRKGAVENGASKKTDILSILCPECQGTGMDTEGDELEKPTVPLSKMYLYKVKANEAHKAWMRNPEVLPKCSIGLNFQSEENCQEKVAHVKHLNFYRALHDEGDCSYWPTDM